MHRSSSSFSTSAVTSSDEPPDRNHPAASWIGACVRLAILLPAMRLTIRRTAVSAVMPLTSSAGWCSARLKPAMASAPARGTRRRRRHSPVRRKPARWCRAHESRVKPITIQRDVIISTCWQLFQDVRDAPRPHGSRGDDRVPPRQRVGDVLRACAADPPRSDMDNAIDEAKLGGPAHRT